MHTGSAILADSPLSANMVGTGIALIWVLESREGGPPNEYDDDSPEGVGHPGSMDVSALQVPERARRHSFTARYKRDVLGRVQTG